MTGFYAIGEVATGSVGNVGTSTPVSTVTSVTVTPSTVALAGGGTADFDWVIAGTNSPSQAATVTTNLGTINSAGVLIVPAATSSAQSGTVTVTSTQDPTKSGTATFTVAALSDTTGPVMQGAISSSKTSTTTDLSWPAATDANAIEYFVSKDGAAAVSTGTTRSKSFTGLAPLTAHTYEVTARDLAGNLSSNSLSVTVVTDAASDDPALVSKTIVVTLKARNLSLQVNASGINWTWSDGRGTVTSFGSGLVGSAAGVLSIPIKTRLLSDGVGILTLDNYNGGNPLTYFGFVGPVRVP